MIDWKYTAIKLRRHYKPLAVIAKEIGSCERHLNRMARGEIEQPRFNTGMRLLDLAYDKLPADVFRKVRL